MKGNTHRQLEEKYGLTFELTKEEQNNIRYTPPELLVSTYLGMMLKKNKEEVKALGPKLRSVIYETIAMPLTKKLGLKSVNPNVHVMDINVGSLGCFDIIDSRSRVAAKSTYMIAEFSLSAWINWCCR